MRRTFTSMLTITALLFLFTGVAEAHVTVYPKTVNTGSYEKFTVRVPVEKETDTVEIRVEMPEGFTVSRVRPMPGWIYETEKSADDESVTAITWSGGQIAPGEFQEFEFQGRTAESAGRYAFPAYQTYADGETVAWAGPSDAEAPAPVVQVEAAGPGTDEHGQEPPAAPSEVAEAAQPDQPAVGGASLLTTVAAYGGLLLGAAALLVALRRK